MSIHLSPTDQPKLVVVHPESPEISSHSSASSSAGPSSVESNASLPVFLAANQTFSSTPNLYLNLSELSLSEASEEEAPRPSIYVNDIVIDRWDVFPYLEDNLPGAPAGQPLSAFAQDPLFAVLAKHLLPKYNPQGILTQTEITVGLKKLAEYLAEEGFTSLELFSEANQFVFTGLQNGVLKKIKIGLPDVSHLYENSWGLRDQIRGEEAAFVHLADINEVAKVEAAFKVRFCEFCICYVQKGEFVDGDDLNHLIDELKFPEGLSLALDWAKQILQLVKRIHEKNGSHRDLKTENIILGTDRRIYIVDNDAFILHKPKGMVDIPTGTLQYFSINKFEAWRHQKPYHGPAEDRYAVGVLLYEIFTGCSFGPQLTSAHPQNEMYDYLRYTWSISGAELCEEHLRQNQIPEMMIAPLKVMILGLMKDSAQERMSLDTALAMIEKTIVELETWEKLKVATQAVAANTPVQKPEEGDHKEST